MQNNAQKQSSGKGEALTSTSIRLYMEEENDFLSRDPWGTCIHI